MVKVYAIFMRPSLLLLLRLLDSFCVCVWFLSILQIFVLFSSLMLWFNLQTRDFCRSIERMHAIHTVNTGYGGFKPNKSKRPENYFRIKRSSAVFFRMKTEKSHCTLAKTEYNSRPRAQKRRRIMIR